MAADQPGSYLMFPGAGASVYYNEAGEPLGWDYPSDDPPEPPDEYDFDDSDEEDFDEYNSFEKLQDEYDRQ